MKTAFITRFSCSGPLSDLSELTLMFLTLIFQYLNKLVESKVGYFSSPKPFHTIKVQRFKDNRIKLLTKFRGKLPLKIYTLIRNLTIKACDLPYTFPPAVRASNFARKAFIKRPKFIQGLFEGLEVPYLLTRGKCQICVFHAKVCPNAFTCCRQRFKVSIGRRNENPVSSACVAFYRNLTNPPVPLTVFMERIWHFIKLPFLCFWIPFAKRQGDTIIGQRPARMLWIGDRLKLMLFFDFRSTTKPFHETPIGFINSLEFLLHGLTWQCVPMAMRGLFHKFKVITHTLIVYIRQAVFIPLTLPLMEINMHLPHIVKQVTNADRIRLIIKRIFIRFHRTIRYQAVIP